MSSRRIDDDTHVAGSFRLMFLECCLVELRQWLLSQLHALWQDAYEWRRMQPNIRFVSLASFQFCHNNNSFSVIYFDSKSGNTARTNKTTGFLCRMFEVLGVMISSSNDYWVFKPSGNKSSPLSKNLSLQCYVRSQVWLPPSHLACRGLWGWSCLKRGWFRRPIPVSLPAPWPSPDLTNSIRRAVQTFVDQQLKHLVHQLASAAYKFPSIGRRVIIEGDSSSLD